MFPRHNIMLNLVTGNKNTGFVIYVGQIKNKKSTKKLNSAGTEFPN